MMHAPAPAASCQAEFAAALLDPSHAGPGGLRAWNGSDPSSRLAVHRNNVVSSLVDALADTFPVVQALVGAKFFRAMAGVFVRRSPPRSPILAHYGRDFPAFIARFEPASCVHYLADVAWLEAARVQAYHAADATPVSTEAVGLALSAADSAGQADELRLTIHPTVSALSSPYAVVSLWAAHQGGGEGDGELAGLDPDQPECAVVLRQNLDVLVLRAPPGAAEFLLSLQRGVSLGEAAARAADAAPGFDLATTLSLLLAHGALTSIHLPRRQDA